MRLHFSIGCYDFRRTTRLRQSIHFSRIPVLFADHVHRRSRVDNKFSFLRFKIWCRQAGTNSPKVRRMLLYFSPLILGCFWPASTLASRAHRSCHSVSPETDPQILVRWGYADEDHPGQINPSEGFWSRMSAWRTTAFVNCTHRIGFRLCELFRKIDEDFRSPISWNTQPNCRVLDE